MQLGPFMSQAAGLLCCPCVDTAITEGEDPTKAPEAITFAPVPFGMTKDGPIFVTIPVCIPCRKKQLNPPGKRLLQAVPS